MNNVQYKTWRDKGENIGIECLVCHRDHWTGNEPTTSSLDPQKQCENCVAIKSEKIREKENAIHQKELEDHRADLESAASGDDQFNPENSLEAGEEMKLKCDHQPSQPI